MARKTQPDAIQDTADERQDTQASQTDMEISEIQPEGPGIQESNDNITLESQTDLEDKEFTADALNLQASDTESNPDSQTGSETGTDLADDGKNFTTPSQTDSESGSDEGTSGSSGIITGSDDASLHTDSETPEISSGSAVQGPDNPDPQTGSDSANNDAGLPEDKIKKPRRRSTKSQSGEDDKTPPQTDSDSAKPARRRRPRATPVLAIDEQRTVETQEDKLKSDLLDLVESQKGKKILTGTIQGVERSADNPNIAFAVIYHGAFKVIIPADETVRPPEDFRDRSPADVMHYLVAKRLGAEIDYIVKGVDPKSGIAAASRLEAMAAKRRQYYFGTDRDGNNLIYEGLSAEARVVSVIRAGMFVDLFGLETYIPLKELSYQRWIDAMAHFQPGQRVLVKILELDRKDRANIRVIASVKQAGENPYEQALRRYTPGSRYVGTVSVVDTNGVFVSLDGGIDCLCSYPKRGRPPRGARVTVRIIGANHESNRIWGAITHMTTAR